MLETTSLPVVYTHGQLKAATEKADEEGYIHMLETTSLPVVYTHGQLKAATEKHEKFQSVKHAIINNNWSVENIDKGFLNIKEEFSTYDGVLSRQNIVVIPQDLRKQQI